MSSYIVETFDVKTTVHLLVLANVRHGKYESTRHPGKHLDADDFINDSSCDDEEPRDVYKRQTKDTVIRSFNLYLIHI